MMVAPAEGAVDLGIRVEAVSHRGFTPEEIAERCVDRIVSVSDSAHPAIREQAHAYKKQLHALVAFYMREAVKSDRTTVYNELCNAGQPKLAELIRIL